MKTAFILGLILLVGILSLYGLYKYSGQKLPTVNGDQSTRIEALEQEVYRLDRTQDSLIEAIQDQKKGYIWE